MNDDLLNEALKVKELFDRTMEVPFPTYADNPRYLQLLAMIEEAKSGNLTEHKHFNYHGNGADELVPYKELMYMVDMFYINWRQALASRPT
jgi:hypothetical protein